MEYTCEIKKQNPTPTICIRTTTSVENLPMVLGQSWGALGAYMEQNGAQPAGVPYVAYFNMDMQNLSVEIGFPLSAPLEGAGALLAATMPDADVAVTMHAGPYTELGAAYEALTEYVQSKNRLPTGIAYEFYYNSPMEVKPEQLLTQIMFVLQD